MRSRPLITSWSTGTSWSTVSRGLASQTGTSQRSVSTFKYRRDPGGRAQHTTFAWSGWKQPDIAVRVDRHDSKQADSRNFV
jgi:hypothetical protein